MGPSAAGAEWPSPAEPDLRVDQAPTDGSVVPELTEPGAGAVRTSAHRRRKRSYVLGSVVGVLVALVVAAAFVRLPFYRFAPGTLYPTQPLITVDGAPTYHDGGDIEFTTVSTKKVSILEYGLAKLDPAVVLEDADKIEAGASVEEIRQVNLELMNDSKQIAEVVALQELGYDIEVTGTGAVVRGVGEGMPADGVLRANDTIVGIDGVAVTTASEAVAAIGSHTPGDTITLRVEPISDDGVPGDPRDEVVTLGSRPDDAGQPLLGVSMGTRDTKFDLPVRISIDSRDVGGPSAGLALSLGLIDVLTPGSLTGETRVAVTGTIDLDGNVGPIGGIRQKTFLAARSGIRLFIVPEEEADEARALAGPDLKVVGVRTLDDALAALADNGGSIDIVEQTASAASTPPGTGGR